MKCTCCGKTLKAASRLAGTTVACPCGAPLDIPSGDSQSSNLSTRPAPESTTAHVPIPHRDASWQSEISSSKSETRTNKLKGLQIGLPIAVAASLLASGIGFAVCFFLLRGDAPQERHNHSTTTDDSPAILDGTASTSNRSDVPKDERPPIEIEPPNAVSSVSGLTDEGPPAKTAAMSTAQGDSSDPHPKGSVFLVGNFGCQMVFAARLERLGERYDFGRTQPQLVVFLMIQNMGDIPKYLPTTTLLGANGSKFSTEMNGLALNPLWFGQHKRINPQIEHHGFIAFEVPLDLTPNLKIESSGLMDPVAVCSLGELPLYSDLDALMEEFASDSSQFLAQ